MVINTSVNRSNNILVEISKEIVVLTGQKVGYSITFPGCTLSSYPETAIDLIAAREKWKYRVYIIIIGDVYKIKDNNR